MRGGGASERRPAALDQSLGRDDAVIILGPVGEVEGAAQVRLGRTRERDLGRVVGDRLDGEPQAAGEPGADGQVGVAVEPEALLAQVRARVLGGGEGAQARSGRHGHVALPGDADDERRFDRRAQALLARREVDHQRRQAGVEGRIDPAVDPELGAAAGARQSKAARRRAPISGPAMKALAATVTTAAARSA